MSKWTWMQEYQADAEAKGDTVRLRMARMRHEAYPLRETDPARAQALYEEGLRLAKQLGEPWWAMYYSQRKLLARMCWDNHFDDTMGLAVENVLEARKPLYASYPQLCSVYLHLVFSYIGVDPVGYAAEIKQAFASLESDVPQIDTGDRFVLEFARRYFALWLNDLDAAEQSAWRALRMAEEGVAPYTSDYHLSFVYEDLCGIDYKRGDMEALRDHAALGEEKSLRSGERIPLSECQLWQALLARRAGDEARALALRRAAIARMSRLKQAPTPHWFNALCAWALDENDLPAALRVRDLELATYADRGQLAYECYCQVERCRLLARMGPLPEDAMTAARLAAGKLRDPAPRLAELDALARGETGSP
jgi:hypothetical protein